MKPTVTKKYFIEWIGSASKKRLRGTICHNTLLSAKRFLSSNPDFADASPRIVEVVTTEKVHKV